MESKLMPAFSLSRKADVSLVDHAAPREMTRTKHPVFKDRGFRSKPRGKAGPTHGHHFLLLGGTAKFLRMIACTSLQLLRVESAIPAAMPLVKAAEAEVPRTIHGWPLK